MLEHAGLLVRPWQGVYRAVLDAGTAKSLGFAQWRPAPWLRGRLFGFSTLAVYETEDESLLFSIRHRWGADWRVYDADGDPVGRVQARPGPGSGHDFALWIEGQRTPALEVPAGRGGPCHLTTANGPVEAATLNRTEDGVELHFAPPLAEEPFVKMLLLTAALVGPG